MAARNSGGRLAWATLFVLIYVKGKSIFRASGSTVRCRRQQHAAGRTVLLYGNYMFPFEIASLLLLVAIIGAVVMAKKRI